MALSLFGKRILITGSTDGLGKATALALAKLGAHVIVHGKDEAKLIAVVKAIQTIPNASVSSILCDLTNEEQILEQFSSIRTVDILINNAGTWYMGDTSAMPFEKVIALTKINTLAPLLITRILLPTLLQSPFSQIVNIVSKDGMSIPTGYYDTVYVATKYAMQGFTEALAKEYYNKHLRVIGYYPGGMETNIFKKAGDKLKKHEPWMFDPQVSVEAIIFMLTRDEKVNIKRMDLINQLED